MSRGDVPRWRRYVRFWRTNVTADVDDEVAFHVQERIDDLVARGMHPAAARDEALRAFGDMDRVKGTMRTIAEGQERHMAFMEKVFVARQDTTYALRVMRTNPAFTAAIVLTLALGIGATTAIFSVVNAVLLRPLPFAGGDRIVSLYERWRGNLGSLAPGVFHDWSEQSSSFAAVAAWQGRTFNLTEGEPARYSGSRVTPSYFKVMRTTPAVGRYFLGDETEASRVVVLSHALWQTRFDGDSGIVGRTIALNGQQHTVVGVAPAEHSLTRYDERLWTVLTFPPDLRTNYGSHTYRASALLKPGVGIAQAQADLDRITATIQAQHPDEMKERTAAVQSYAEGRIGDFATQLWVIFGAVAFVLLIGCGNVASLLLARATTRRKEIAIRGALGGARGRLVRQLLTESLLLAFIGGALGLVVAQLGVRFLVGMGPEWVPRLGEAALDPEVLVFALLATATCGVLFGLAPAIRATRVDLQAELRDGGRGSRGAVRDHVRAGLIITEVAVALVLMVSAGLFIRSAIRLQQVATGFDVTGVTMMRVALPPDRYDSAGTVSRAFTSIVGAVRGIPGVQSAGAGSRVPMWGGSIDMGLRVEGRPADPKSMALGHIRIVTPGYLETVGIPLKRGRLLRESDIVTGAPWVMVVNETFARTNFPGEDAIGKRVSGWTLGPEPEWREIVGIVGDVRAFGQANDVPTEMYIPHTQVSAAWWNSHQRNMTIVAKAPERASPAALMRAELKRVDPLLPSYDVQTMEDVVAQSTETQRFNTLLLTMLGLTGLVLAAIGIYGVIAFFVSQRTHEIGVRVALGASTGSVVVLVVRQALALCASGIVLGGVAAYWCTRVLERLLFQVDPGDPATFTIGAGVLLLVSLGAAWIPARRASRIAPVNALGAH